MAHTRGANRKRKLGTVIASAAIVAVGALSVAAEQWLHIKDEKLFRHYVVGKVMTTDKARMRVRKNGRISGTVSGGKKLTGAWVWSGEFFCRRAIIDRNDIGTDCQKIEISGPKLRYTRDRGKGKASTVTLSD